MFLGRKKKSKGKQDFSHSPMLLEAEVNVFPGTIAIFAETVVASLLELHHLEVILLGSNLSWSQFTKIAGECHEASVVSGAIIYNAAVEDFTVSRAGELSYMELATVRLDEGYK